MRVDLGLTVAMFGVVIALVIALRQEKQLQHLKQITSRFEKDKNKRLRIEKFFKIGSHEPRYRIVYPSYFRGKPLDSVHAGDYLALSTANNALTALLPEGNVKLEPVTPSAVKQKASAPVLDRDFIFICSPTANSFLRDLFPALTVKSQDEIDGLPKQATAKVLPCWFVEDHTAETPVLKIWDLGDPRRCLASPAEDAYVHAKIAVDAGAYFYKPPKPLQDDYAILLRLQLNDRYIFVLAGIHQYGTLMAAKYLSELFENGPDEDEKPDKYAALLLGDDDFVMVVKGEFSHDHFRVNATDTAGPQWVWRKQNDGTWERVGMARN